MRMRSFRALRALRMPTSLTRAPIMRLFAPCVLLVPLLAGCGGGSNKTFTIAMIAKSSTHPVFLSGRQGAEVAAAELSKANGVTVKIDWLTPPNEDGAVQAQRIAQAVNAGESAILLSASDAGKVIGAVNEAVDRGVPVMTFDSDVAGSKRFSV